MTRQELFDYCCSVYGRLPDFPFEGSTETAVLRHADTGKWFALVMRVSRRKFGQSSDEIIDIVNLKVPLELFGAFGTSEGVEPAYHMNKLHWASVLLPDAPNDVLEFLLNASYRATQSKRCKSHPMF